MVSVRHSRWLRQIDRVGMHGLGAVVFRCWASDNFLFTGSADRVEPLRETARNRIESR